ncbi:MAG: hypothetical protein RMM53_13905, partial [Bacteroidia bacterium]|nr:hypothetical protein [Bacteroidia bacterium]MDW8335301.1 hypothetical protein [Bacteroidia bacterium]
MMIEDVFSYFGTLGKSWDAEPYRFDLNAFRALMADLGNPHRNLRCVHVAGTNGKGSVSWMLAESLRQSGYRTGLYTSPHLLHFTERIRINGEPLPESEWRQVVESRRTIFEAHRPSVFESVTAVAFALFAEKSVDVAVLETGL